MRTIFVMMDSLNRHYLNAYTDASWIQTPNIDRLAERGVVFDNHWAGSLPCMPARREMMTGRLNFLEAPWSSIEPFDVTLPHQLRATANVYSHLITDHYHYFHAGGDGYHDLFDSWEFERGQEGDKWRPVVEAPSAPQGTRGKSVHRKPYWRNRSMLKDPEDDLSYPTPRCFQHAIDFIEQNHQADDWHLHLEVFDPHEPFDCPQRYLDLYNDTWDRPLYNWPSYAPLDQELDDAAAVDHIRKRYAGTLTMADRWLGKLLEAFDRHDMWRNTVVVFSTDHGHLLGEHGYWAKNYMHDYAELAHIPLIVCAPQAEAGRRCRALTQTIDFMPTFLELHGAELPPHVHGKSLVHLLSEEAPHHDAVLYGYFGKDINVTDGRYTYARQADISKPTHLHTANPGGIMRSPLVAMETFAKAEIGTFLPQAEQMPIYRIEMETRHHHNAPDHHVLYDLENDPSQEQPIRDAALEARMVETLRTLMERYEAPPSQYERVGLDAP